MKGVKIKKEKGGTFPKEMREKAEMTHSITRRAIEIE